MSKLQPHHTTNMPIPGCDCSDCEEARNTEPAQPQRSSAVSGITVEPPYKIKSVTPPLSHHSYHKQRSELEKIEHKLKHFTGQTFAFSEVEFLFNALATERQRAKESIGAYRAEVKSHQRTNDLLATERQLKQKALGDWAHELDRANTLEKELTTERQRREQAELERMEAGEEWSTTLDTLTRQLLSAQAAIARHNSATRPDCPWGIIEGNLSALREHDAEIRKPLVDTLKQISEHCSRPSKLATVFCDDIKRIADDALAKVKEGE